MDRTRGTPFTLHLNHRRDSSPKIFHAGGCPGVCPLTHGRRRRDGEQGDDFIQLKRDAGHGLVAIHRFKIFQSLASLFFVLHSLITAFITSVNLS